MWWMHGWIDPAFSLSTDFVPQSTVDPTQELVPLASTTGRALDATNEEAANHPHASRIYRYRESSLRAGHLAFEGWVVGAWMDGIGIGLQRSSNNAPKTHETYTDAEIYILGSLLERHHGALPG